MRNIAVNEYSENKYGLYVNSVQKDNPLHSHDELLIHLL